MCSGCNICSSLWSTGVWSVRLYFQLVDFHKNLLQSSLEHANKFLWVKQSSTTFWSDHELRLHAGWSWTPHRDSALRLCWSDNMLLFHLQQHRQEFPKQFLCSQKCLARFPQRNKYFPSKPWTLEQTILTIKGWWTNVTSRTELASNKYIVTDMRS